MEIRDKTILLISPNSWGKMKLSKHHYALELSLENRVYFLNPPDISHRGQISVEGVPGQENLWVVSYRPVFRGRRFLPSAVYRALLRKQIAIIERKLRRPVDLVWSFSATHFTDLTWFNAGYRVYHPVDELTDEEQIRIADTSDIVFTCTEHIRTQLNGVRPPVHVISHGLSRAFVDEAHRRLASNESRPAGRGLHFGYSGNLFSEYLDRALFRRIIDSHPQVTFEFWGPLRPQDSNVTAWVTSESRGFVKELECRSNVVLHGVTDQDSLVREMGAMDGFIVIYQSNAEHFTISNSHKILEYLSTGKAVVSTRLIDGERYCGMIEMSEDEDNALFPQVFERVVNNIQELNCQEMRQRRIRFALANSYRSHLSRIEDAMKAGDGMLNQLDKRLKEKVGRATSDRA